MEIISGYVSTIKKNEFVKLDLVEAYWVGSILEDKKSYFFAQIGVKTYALSYHDEESEAVDSMNKFILQLTPEIENED